MLIRLALENFLSFGSRVEFSALATREKHHRERTAAGPLPGLTLLPIAALYGPNASGKSNLFKALEALKAMVVEGTRAGERLLVQPFRLDPERLAQPSRFDLEFIAGGKVYRYELAATATEVEAESLTEIRSASEALVFSRNGSKFKFGPGANAADQKEELFLEFIGRGTRANQLFLHESLDRTVKQLEPVVRWFRKLVLIDPNMSPPNLGIQLSRSDNFRAFCSRAVRDIGAGLIELGTETRSLDDMAFPEEVNERIRKDMGGSKYAFLQGSDDRRFYAFEGREGIEVARLVSHHAGAGGEKVRFDLSDESDGTRRFIDLLPALHNLGRETNEDVIFVDELDRSLHTGLTRSIIESYLLAWEKGSRSQFLFTTHDTTLFDQDLFRRDELWLVEKNEVGETHLKSLSDFKIRSDKRLMSDYVEGRFGAIPPGKLLRLRGATAK